MKNGIPKNIMLSGITNVVISAGRLIISNELKILLPTTFPRARLSLFFFAAATDTITSGRLVPNAIADAANTSVPMFNSFDNSITEVIVYSAEKYIAIILAVNIGSVFFSSFLW